MIEVIRKASLPEWCSRMACFSNPVWFRDRTGRVYCYCIKEGKLINAWLAPCLTGERCE